MLPAGGYESSVSFRASSCSLVIRFDLDRFKVRRSGSKDQKARRFDFGESTTLHVGLVGAIRFRFFLAFIVEIIVGNAPTSD